MKQTVLITGTSSGIGRATAICFAANGWNVIATMRQPEKELELTRHENILVAALDVKEPGTIDLAIKSGIEKFGRIDAVINNAGYGQYGLFEAVTKEQVLEQFEVNVFGVMNTIRSILPHFRENKKGTIINISSGAGRFTLPMISMYTASKFALEGFSETLSFELSALNIAVKIVEPGGTYTNFIQTTSDRFSNNPELKDYESFTAATFQMFDGLKNMPLATPEEVAEVIYRAATDGTDTLRYVVGNEDFKRRIENRLKLPDQEYVNSVKNSYLKFMQ